MICRDFLIISILISSYAALIQSNEICKAPLDDCYVYDGISKMDSCKIPRLRSSCERACAECRVRTGNRIDCYSFEIGTNCPFENSIKCLKEDPTKAPTTNAPTKPNDNNNNGDNNNNNNDGSNNNNNNNNDKNSNDDKNKDNNGGDKNNGNGNSNDKNTNSNNNNNDNENGKGSNNGNTNSNGKNRTEENGTPSWVLPVIIIATVLGISILTILGLVLYRRNRSKEDEFDDDFDDLYAAQNLYHRPTGQDKPSLVSLRADSPSKSYRNPNHDPNVRTVEVLNVDSNSVYKESQPPLRSMEQRETSLTVLSDYPPIQTLSPASHNVPSNSNSVNGTASTVGSRSMVTNDNVSEYEVRSTVHSLNDKVVTSGSYSTDLEFDGYDSFTSDTPSIEITGRVDGSNVNISKKSIDSRKSIEF